MSGGRAKVNLLVIGYGNALRGDDGVGPYVARAVATWDNPRVRAIVAAQLVPELAAELAAAVRAVFVDAGHGMPGSVRLRRFVPAASLTAVGHASDPGGLLATARAIYGHAPQAWLLSVGVSDTEFGEVLSETARKGAARALTLLARCCPPPPAPGG